MEKPLRLKEARKNAGLTQKQVAEKLGISQNNYSYWENGKVKVDSGSLSQLAEIFGCSVDYILGKTNGVKMNIEGHLRRELEFINFVQSGKSRFDFYKQLCDEDKYLFGFLCLYTEKELVDRKETVEMTLNRMEHLVFKVDRWQLYQDRLAKDKDEK